MTLPIADSKPADSQPSGVAGRDFVSWSQLSTFRQCPLKYYFRYIERLPPAFIASSLAFGSAIHRAIEFHHRQQLEGLASPSLDLLLAEFWDEWKQRTAEAPEVRFGKNEDLNTVGHAADRMLTRFLESEAAQPLGTIVAIEEPFRDVLLDGHPEFLGYVDLIIDDGQELIVRDYKTARSRWSQGTAEASAQQLLLYGELIRMRLPDRKLRLQFCVITKSKTPLIESFEVQNEPHRIERTRLVAERTLEAIATGVFYPNPSAMNCSTCPYRATCAAWRG